MKKLLCIFISIILLTVSVVAEESASPSYSYVLMEGSTATLLYADNGNYVFEPYHFSKLMTLLLAVEAIERGELSFDTVVTVSDHANSMPDPQIWLRIGEEITVSELITSITVGNANDACVCLAEAVSGTEEAFVALMNQRAKELGMSRTYYADSIGLAEGSYTTACDLAILASELSRYDELTEYFTTWLTYVRDGEAQLVNNNKLVRNYNGITGMKAFSTATLGNCVVASAKREDLTMICVIIGEQEKDAQFATAKEKMTVGFSAYMLYRPKATDIYCRPVKVSKGVKNELETYVGDLGKFIIRKSREDEVEVHAEYFDGITAPIKEGDAVGRIVYTLDGEEIYYAPISAKEPTEKISFFSAFKKLFLQLIKM